MEKTEATRVLAGHWLVCPQGHYVAKAEQDVRFNHMGWRSQLTWLQGRSPSGEYACRHEGCRGQWLRQYGGQAHVWTTKEAPSEA